MKNTKWILVGKVKEAHGLSGELFVILFAKQMDWIEQVQQLRVHHENSEQILKLQGFRQKNQGLIIRTGFKNRTEAEAYKGWLVSVPEELLVSKKNERIYLREIMHFMVFNEGNETGQIVGFSSNGPQDLLQIKTQDKTVEIPFVEPFIKDIDFANKRIDMNFPVDLLEINQDRKK